MSIRIVNKKNLDVNIIDNYTSTVGEPSIGSSKHNTLFTGNWFAVEQDNDTWRNMNPFDQFPRPQGSFCCDQTVISSRCGNYLFWLLQYSRDGAGNNTLRVAFQYDNTGDYYWYDLVPHEVNDQWHGEWFDYNHAAITDDYLYIGTNVFRDRSFTRAVIFRIKLDGIETALDYDYFDTTNYGSLRCVQGAHNVMYIGTHGNDTDEIMVFEWPENSDTVDDHRIRVSRTPYWGHSHILPDGNDWLSRCDRRITGAWYRNNEIGFMWTAPSSNNKPNPYVRGVRIDTQNWALIDEPDIWHSQYAFAYPDVSPNSEGVLGITVFAAGDSMYPSHVIGYHDNTKWRLYLGSRGTNGPSDNKWGDYLTCRNHFDRDSWEAVGFVLENGSSRDHIVPKYVEFSVAPDVSPVV